MSVLRFLLSVVASLTLSTFFSAHDDPTFEQRIERLSESLESARTAAHIPGMSIAIVKDDKIVWSHGFGVAEVGSKEPADAQTLYGIGSTTKAFTATLVGMLVDEGKLSWDDPVTDYLPYFDLAIRTEDEHARCTLRDLLCHRSGFSRMGVLLLGGKATREEVLRKAAGAEPWDGFRKGFHYCNITYLAAGQAAGVAADSTWDDLIRNRIFGPLGMRSSTPSRTEARTDPRLAKGYRYDKSIAELVPERGFDLSVIGPAGSVHSNVLDMAQWLRLQLGRGQVDGKRLISEESIRETWTPQIEMGDGGSYGLGWMLREVEGRKVVEHGGNVDGFTTEVGFLPEENLGFVLLMNLSASPLQHASLEIVFDALLGDRPDAAPSEPLDALASARSGRREPSSEACTGTFVASFATFRDEEFRVEADGDSLALTIPSQGTLDLGAPDVAGMRDVAQAAGIQVSFEPDEAGNVVALVIHQGGFHFRVPREGLEAQPVEPNEELEKYAGTFVRAQGGKRVKIFLLKGHLAMEDGRNWLSFEAPDSTGFAALRARADQGATFEVDADGEVDSFVFRGSAGDRLFTRLADFREGELPTLDEVLALRRTEARVAALESSSGTRVRGSVWFAQAGLRGTVTIETQGKNRYATHMDFGSFGRLDAVGRGAEAWTYNPLRGLETLRGDELAQALLEHPGAVEGDWRDYFDSVEVSRSDTLHGRAVVVVRLRKGDLPSRSYWVDAENGDVLRVEAVSLQRYLRLPLTIDYSDFEELNGIRSAMRVQIENPASGRTVMTFETIETGLELDDDAFTLGEK